LELASQACPQSGVSDKFDVRVGTQKKHVPALLPQAETEGGEVEGGVSHERGLDIAQECRVGFSAIEEVTGEASGLQLELVEEPATRRVRG